MSTVAGIPIADTGAPMGSLVTQPGQLQYGPALLGAGSAAGWRSLTNWRSLPEADVSDTQRPQAHGAYPGDVYGGSQVVTFTYLVRGLPDTKALALDTLEQYLPMDGVERPLVVNDGTGAWFRMGRVIAREVPQDVHFRHGPVECSAQFLCADPRRYSLTQQLVTLDMPASAGGLVYPLTYPLGYGTSTGGSRAVTNTGSVSTPMVATFIGPLVAPRITSSAGWTLDFGLTLAAGEQLVVDTSRGSALLDGVTDRLYTITTTSSPIERCVLPPGDSTMALTANSGTGTVQVAYRDARM